MRKVTIEVPKEMKDEEVEIAIQNYLFKNKLTNPNNNQDLIQEWQNKYGKVIKERSQIERIINE